MNDRAGALVVVVVGLAVSCVTQPVGPVADAAGYGAKAAVTVEAVSSAVASTRLAGRGELDGRTFRAFAEQVADDAAGTIGTAQDTFERIAPPDDASRPVRAEVLDAVAAARRSVVDVRAALQGDDAGALGATVAALDPVADRLEALDQELGGVKKFLGVTLGILTAIGGFVDMGDLVANAATGARFGMNLALVVVFGVVGIVVYAEMAGRVAAVSTRPVFDLVRERLGSRFAFANLAASFLINLLTLTAELAGVALAVSMLASVSYVLLIPVAAVAVWLVLWRMPFETMERIFGLLGLALIGFAVAAWRLGIDAGAVAGEALHPSVPATESPWSMAYFAVALLGAAMTPYEVFFFSSGAVEEHWTSCDLSLNRANVFIGFPLGGALSLSIMVVATQVLQPAGIAVDDLAQVPLPVTVALGRVGLAMVLLGIVAATFGAALETSLSAGYAVAQYFGWAWGKGVRPRDAARFHLLLVVAVVVSTLVGITGVDPVKVTEYSIVLSAAALPLTYLPIFVVANDRQYLGDRVNGLLANVLGTVYLVVLLAVSVAAVPLIIITRGGSA